MEVAVELDDDLFFQNLSKQISLLIMDDDEGPATRCPSAAFQGLSRAHLPTAPPPSSLCYEQLGCRRESKGTGVFIPRSSSHPRRKHKQAAARLSSSSSSSSRHHEKNTTRLVVTSPPSYSS